MCAATFTYFYIPETRDRTLEEIHEMFEARLPARQFKGYVCVGVEELAAQGAKRGLEEEGESLKGVEGVVRQVEHVEEKGDGRKSGV